jgi:hypothetical protein
MDSTKKPTTPPTTAAPIIVVLFLDFVGGVGGVNRTGLELGMPLREFTLKISIPFKIASL